MKTIKTFEKFNKLPDFEFEGNIKKISFKIKDDIIEAYAGAWSGYEGSEKVNNFYFRVDKKNVILLKKHEIKSVKSIDEQNNIITFIKNHDNKFFSEISCKFKVKLFSKRSINIGNDIGSDDCIICNTYESI